MTAQTVPATDAILTLQDIDAAYHGAVQVLRGMSLTAQRGEVTALLGANGAGKSTTLKAISGLLAAEGGAVTDGRIYFQGEDITRTPPERIVQMGLIQVLEGRRIVQDMTVLENLKLGAFTRKDRHNIAADIDRVYGYFPRLQERTGQAGYLSGGEQQMLAIGRALMARPSLILMDEPSMGLSPLLVKDVFSIIKQLNQDLQLSIVLVEQNARMALAASHQAYMMEHGHIVMSGAAADLMQREDIKEVYLGGDMGEDRMSFTELKAAKRAAR